MVRFLAIVLTALVSGSSWAQPSARPVSVVVDSCPRISRPALERLLRLELGTTVEVLDREEAVGPADVRVECTSATIRLSVEPPATDARLEQADRILPSRALAGREGERLLALTIAELVAASSLEGLPPQASVLPAGANLSTPVTASGPQPAPTTPNAEPPAQQENPSATEQPPATVAPTPPSPPRRSKPPSGALDNGAANAGPGLRLGASALLLTIPLRSGPTWYGGRAWIAQRIYDNFAVEAAASFAMAEERNSLGDVTSQLMSAHAFLRYLTHLGDVILDLGVGGSVAYMLFAGAPNQADDFRTTDQHFFNGGPTIQLRVLTDTQPFFASITLEAAAILQPVDITGETERGTDSIELVVASVRGVWLGLSFDLGVTP